MHLSEQNQYPLTTKPAAKHKTLSSFLRRFGFILAAIALITWLGNTIELRPKFQDLLDTIVVAASLWVALTLANGYLANLLDNYIPWLKAPVKRLLVSILGTIVISGIIVVLIYLVYLTVLGYSLADITTQNWKGRMLLPLVITFFVSLFLHSRSFLLGWRQTAINAERLQKESIASQYESLKAQVNPHFLFNSLNALTSLVETDQKLAVKFIRKLSEVYRYVLDSRQKEVVTLPEELMFLESYTYLQQIRLGNALQVKNDLPQDSNLLVVPLGLQMLLENAIKHNAALEDAPLQVQLYLEHDYLVVENNLQERRIREEDSTNTGLANLKARYSYLTDKQVLVQHTQEKFIIKLPVLHFKG